jgi:hypothetical protein
VTTIYAHHCNGALPLWSIFWSPISRVVLILAERKRSTHEALVRWCELKI